MDSGTGSILDIAVLGDGTALMYRTTLETRPNLRAADTPVLQLAATEDLNKMHDIEPFRSIGEFSALCEEISSRLACAISMLRLGPG